MDSDKDDNGLFLARDCLTGMVALYSQETGTPATNQSENISDNIASAGSDVNCRDDTKVEHDDATKDISNGYGINEKDESSEIPFIGPGLIDLQINGVNGIDFNSAELSQKDLLSAANYLLSRGVTTFYPTVITNSVKKTIAILSGFNRACNSNPLLERCIGGIHLEGPFISKINGYRGAHNRKFVRAPDMKLFKKFQDASGGRVRIISLSPEWDNAVDFVREVVKEGVIVGIAHSAATSGQVDGAVSAGARLASHLGNAVPVVLPRHANIIFDQLANNKLFASLIADGFHMPGPFMKIAIKVKGRKTILVSDATCFAGMKPGEYKAHIGGDVVLSENGRLQMKEGGGLLAGSAKLLTDNIEYLIGSSLADLSRAWYMASSAPCRLLELDKNAGNIIENDRVVFRLEDGKIIICKIYKNGESITLPQC